MTPIPFCRILSNKWLSPTPPSNFIYGKNDSRKMQCPIGSEGELYHVDRELIFGIQDDFCITEGMVTVSVGVVF